MEGWVVLMFAATVAAGAAAGGYRAGKRRAAAPPTPPAPGGWIPQYWPALSPRDQLELIAIAMDIRIQVIDRDLMYVDALGRSRPQEIEPWRVIGARIGDGLSPEQAAPHLGAARRALAGETVMYQWDWRLPDGSTLWNHTVVSPIHTSTGAISAIVSTTHDMTATWDTQLQLERSRSQFRTMFHTSPVATMISRLDNGTILDVNEAYVRLTGLTREELVGRTATALGLWQDQQRERISAILRKRRHMINLDSTIRDKSGSLRTTLTSLQLVELDGETCVMRTDYDITERVRSEEALRASEAKFRSLVMSLDDRVVVLDAGLRQVEVFGRSRHAEDNKVERFLGKTATEMVGPELASIHEEAGREALTGNVVQYEWPWTFPEGMTEWFQTRLTPMHGPAGQVT